MFSSLTEYCDDTLGGILNKTFSTPDDQQAQNTVFTESFMEKFKLNPQNELLMKLNMLIQIADGESEQRAHVRCCRSAALHRILPLKHIVRPVVHAS